MPQRLFIAIPLTPDAGRAVSLVQQGWRRRLANNSVRWVAPENVHLTLSFLGEVEDERAAALPGIIRASAAGLSAIPLTGGELEAFPAPSRASVLVLLVQEVQGHQLSELVVRLRGGLRRGGFVSEDRPWRAHLTLGRSRSLQPVDCSWRTAPSVTWLADTITLTASELTVRGPRYTALVNVPLPH